MWQFIKFLSHFFTTGFELESKWQMSKAFNATELSKIQSQTVMSKIQNVTFDITVPPCKLCVKDLMSKITMRPFNSMQMSF